jgi:voltage-gated potassium channel Kch
MNKKPSIKARFRYLMDTLYSRGTAMVIVSLGLFSLVIILVATATLVLSQMAPGGEASYSFVEALWATMLHTLLGAGSIGGRESIWGYRFFTLALSFASIFVTSFFISALTNGMANRVSDLRRGRSVVVEDGHTVILGWSEQVFTVISELVVSMSGRSKSCITVLGPEQKVVMEEQIRQHVGSTGRTRIVCRTGDPMDLADLKIASLNTARNINVLQPSGSHPDADVIKIILAILNHPERKKQPYQVVAPIRNLPNIEVARVAGKNEVEWVITSDIVARLVAQTAVQSGLSAVYDDLFRFSGDEIYFKDAKKLLGTTFGAALSMSGDNALLGVRSPGRQVILCPPMDQTFVQGDQLIVLAKNNIQGCFDPSEIREYQESAISPAQMPADEPRQILVLGWNWRGCRIVQELDQYVPAGSEVTVMADQEKVEEDIEKECGMIQNLKTHYLSGDTDDRQTLERLDMKRFDHVILLSYSDKLSPQRADAKTIITLLHLRDIADRDLCKFTVVTEMMDSRNHTLAAVARPDDTIISDRLISQMIAQIAENRELNSVFQDLLDPRGIEIYLKPALQYVRPGEEVNFYTIVEAGRRRCEVAIGYRFQAKACDPKQSYGVVLNPDKSIPIVLTQQDQVIVFAHQ